MTDEHIVENVQATMSKIIQEIPGGFENISRFHLVAASFPALPLYVSTGKSLLVRYLE